MTPEALKIFCMKNGGQKAVSIKVGRHSGYISDMCCGRAPINEKFLTLIRLIYKDV